MRKNYGTRIGYVFLKGYVSCGGRYIMDVLYKDDSVLIVMDWPNTPLPRYYILAKELNAQAWRIGHQYMSTLNTGGITLTVLPSAIESDFDKAVSTFETLEQWAEKSEQLKRDYAAFVAEKKKNK